MRKTLLFAIMALIGVFAQAQVTYTVTVPTGTNACYIAGEMNGWSQQEMTLISPNTYSITIESANTSQKYKYCSGPNWSYVEKQSNCTSDVPDRTYTPNDVVACWAAIWTPDAPKYDITIKVKLPASWTTPKIHYWGSQSTSWPGVDLIQDGEWWTYSFTQVELINFLFNNNSSPQTTNIENVTSSTCYEVLENNSVQVVSCVPEPVGKTYNVTVPEGTLFCYIAGDMTGWSYTEMTQLTPTTYTITIESATDLHKYKYLSGPGWAWEEVQADCVSAIADRSYSPNDVVACWKGIYNPAATPQDYVYNVTVPEGTVKCFIVGDFNNWGDFVEMTKLTPTRYTITLNTTTPNGYKFTSGPAWEYEELQADSSQVSNRTYTQENIVARWNQIFTPTTTSISETNAKTWISSTNTGIYIEHDGMANVRIYTLQGSLIQQTMVENNTLINNLAKGVYLIRINDKNFKAIVH